MVLEPNPSLKERVKGQTRYLLLYIHRLSMYNSAMHTPNQIGKDLVAASSTPLVLAILAEQDNYGYAILQRVREVSGGALEWTDGMLYPVLHRLERADLIQSRWEKSESGRQRKYYSLTPRGKKQLTQERAQWQTVDATLRQLWQSLAQELSTPPLKGFSS